MASNHSFEYTPLDLDRPALRLLNLKAAYNSSTFKLERPLIEGERPPATEKKSKIECEIIEAFLDTDFVPDYEAVSYTWGSTDDPREISLEGSAFLVTHNLWSLLHDIRHLREDRILWIDAICIDQGNHGERGHQVQQMNQIYHNAQCVIVWLGPLTHPTNILMNAMVELQQQMRGLDWAPNDARWQFNRGRIRGKSQTDQITLQSALKELLERPWFRRVWIIQEVANARAAIVHCGFKTVSARLLAASPGMLEVIASPHCQAILDVMPGPSRKGSWWSQRRDLYTLLNKFSGTEATREHDRIFALLGLCPEANAKISVDYSKPVPQLIQETLSFIYNCPIISLPTINTVEGLLAMLVSGNIHRMILDYTLKYSDTAYEKALKAISSLSGTEFHADYDNAIGTLLSHLLSNGNVTAVRLFLDHHPTYININLHDAKNHTPLYHASELGNEAIVKLLLSRGAKRNCSNENGNALLNAAMRNGHEGVVRLLLDQDSGNRSVIERGVALITASMEGHETIVRLLLDQGANSNCVDSYGNTPVIQASAIGDVDIVRLLLDSGANYDHGNHEGYTALMYSSFHGHKGVVQLLLERGADSETRSALDETALLLAVERDKDEVVHILLNHGADCNTRHKSQHGAGFDSPVSAAMQHGHRAIVRLLFANGAKLRHVNDDTSAAELTSTSARTS